MNTFWLKIAGLVVVVVGAIFLISVFTSGTGSKPKEPEKTFYDQAEEDKERFLTKPQALNTQEQSPVPEQDQPTVNKKIAEYAPPVTRPVEPPKPTTLYFKPLSEIDKIEAERLLNAAVPGRSVGRLQTGFKLMMDTCRQIIRRWPDSSYAYRAKQMIADMPIRYRDRYKVTEEELDISMFAKPRPGTRPFKFEEPH